MPSVLSDDRAAWAPRAPAVMQDAPARRPRIAPLPFLVVLGGLVLMAIQLGAVCGSREAGFRANIVADLRNLVTAQEGLQADSGRFGTVDSLIAWGRYRTSASVHLEQLGASDTSYAVRGRHESLGDIDCTVSVALDGSPDGEPQCTRFAQETAHDRRAILYGALLLVAIALSARGAFVHRGWGTAGQALLVLTLALAHPFWDSLQGTTRMSCRLGTADPIALGLAAFAVVYLFLRSRTGAAREARALGG